LGKEKIKAMRVTEDMVKEKKLEDQKRGGVI